MPKEKLPITKHRKTCREIEVLDRGNYGSEQYQGRDRQQRSVKDSLDRISVTPIRPSPHTMSSRGISSHLHDKQEVGLSLGDGMFDRYIGIDYSGAEGGRSVRRYR